MTKFSVLDLIEQLNGIVNNNPEIDFSEVEVTCNGGEYSLSKVRLEYIYIYNFGGGEDVPTVDLY